MIDNCVHVSPGLVLKGGERVQDHWNCKYLFVGRFKYGKMGQILKEENLYKQFC